MFSCPRYQLQISGDLHAPAVLPPRKASPLDDGEENVWASGPRCEQYEELKINYPTGTLNSELSVAQHAVSRRQSVNCYTE
jgi:hypothetical protein